MPGRLSVTVVALTAALLAFGGCAGDEPLPTPEATAALAAAATATPQAAVAAPTRPVALASATATSAPTPGPTPEPPEAVAVSKEGRIALLLGGGEIVFLTTGPSDLMPSVSPDGRKVAFVRLGAPDVAGTYVVNPDDGSTRRVAPTVSILSRPAWSPDSRDLALRDPAADRLGIWTVAADGRHLRRVFEGNPLTPAWSPDGRWIAFANGVSTKDGGMAIGLYVTDPLEERTRLVAEGRFGEVAWSPEGDRLAVVASPKDGPRALLLLDPNGGEALTLATDLAEGPWTPSWSPDGRAITVLLAAEGVEGEERLAVVAADGTGATTLLDARALGTAAWSADGRYLVVARATTSGAPEVLRIATDGSSPARGLGPGEAPCAAGVLSAVPAATEAAAPRPEEVRRAQLFLMSGGWS